MKVNITLEIGDDARRGINMRHGLPGKASHTEVRQEIEVAWEALCQDYAYELVMDAEWVKDHPAVKESA